MLERHHCYLTFQLLLRNKESAILGHLSPISTEFQTIRKTIISSILGTDMAHHFDHISDLEKLLAAQEKMNVDEIMEQEEALQVPIPKNRKRRTSVAVSSPRAKEEVASVSPPRRRKNRRGSVTTKLADLADLMEESSAKKPAQKRSSSVTNKSVGGHSTQNPSPKPSLPSKQKVNLQKGIEPESAESLLLARGIVHASDLVSQCYPFQYALQWARRVTEEFQNQYSNEVEKGLPPSVPLVSTEKELFGYVIVCVEISVLHHYLFLKYLLHPHKSISRIFNLHLPVSPFN